MSDIRGVTISRPVGLLLRGAETDSDSEGLRHARVRGFGLDDSGPYFSPSRVLTDDRATVAIDDSGAVYLVKDDS